MRHPVRLLALLATVSACAGAPAPSAAPLPAPVRATSADITEADLRQRLFLIADDSTMGRESGSRGDWVVADYIASEFRRLGLEPAGENGTYFQTVPFFRLGQDATSKLTVNGKTLYPIDDFLSAIFSAPPRTFLNVPSIYGGVATDSSTWAPADQVAGKLVVLTVPRDVGLFQAFGGLRSPHWGDAVAVAADAMDGVGPELLAVLRDGRPAVDTARNPNGQPLYLLTHRATSVILNADPRTLTPGANGSAVSGFVDVAREPVRYPARNVVAIYRGSDPALNHEYVSLTAHNDHVGYDHTPVDHDSLRAFDRVVRPMGADSPNREPTTEERTRIRAILDSLRRVHPPRLDSIRNGADDDGSGTVALLEIAEKLAAGHVRTKRSILFVSHTGEEAGLLGSRWYTDHATVPVDSIVAEIDEDMVGRGRADDYPDGADHPAATPTYLEVIGAKRLSREFGDTLEAANARQPLPFVFDYTYDAPGHPLQYYCRADHYSYARYGIPSVAFSRGEHLDYHQVTDEAQYIDYPALARVARMVYTAAVAVADMPVRPRLSAPKPADPHGACRQ